MNYPSITQKLFNWYNLHGRDLPWRQTTDPYKIWLSEVILQQTRVNQGLPYYYKFIEKYPTVEQLAIASEQEVLRTWQGLGYYSRARNLHACAKILVDKYNGNFPKTHDEILKLPGIGQYTAAAIASFAFKEVVPAIDGNVFRVLSRLFGIEKDILSGKARKTFAKAADSLMPQDKPDVFNQAMMEFGAMQCKPKNPACVICSLSMECYARATGRQSELPVKIKKVKVRQRHFAYLIVRDGDRIWMKERPKGDIWQGLYDFVLVENDKENTFELLRNKLSEGSYEQFEEQYAASEPFKHVLTHQVIFARFVELSLNKKECKKLLSQETKGAFFTLEEIRNLPKPVLVSKYLNAAIF